MTSSGIDPTADIDVTSVDTALATTRVVRRRLDLERPVDQQILMDCIDIAEQAPTGGNQGSRRWIIVRDQRTKDRLAELYMEAAGQWMIESADKLAGTGHKQEQVMASAAYLAKHLAEVQAIVIPTIIGTHDGSGRPGLFDSVIQAVWSFSVALRARGLGSAWTTANLGRQDDIAELLGIPDGMTQIAMIPVGWTKGTNFKLAPRLPSREIAYGDKFGHTWESGPSDPPQHSDGAGGIVEVDIKSKPEFVWPYISDIAYIPQFSEEATGARWADDVTTPDVGSRFIGSNSNSFMGDWEIDCFVSHYAKNESFGWVTSDRDNPGARWRFDADAIAGATRLRYSVVIGPGPSGLTQAIAGRPDKEDRMLSGRVAELRKNMSKVVEGIKEAAEADAAAARVERSSDGAPPPLS
ncbi:MAG: nitroreductase [Candidatus Poriferisodalaceae bacterium]|jgi:nitroreductase